MVWVIAFSSPDNLVISSISLCDQNYFHLSNFRYLDYSCCRDKVNGPAGRHACCHGFCIATKTILSWRDNFVPSTGTHSSGQLYRDTEILPIYRDFAKTHANPDTDGNSPYHRAVICKVFNTIPGYPTHKQEFGSPSLQPSLHCQTHAFLPARTLPPRQLHHDTTYLHVYRDFATETTFPWQHNSCPSIGICKINTWGSWRCQTYVFLTTLDYNMITIK